MGSHLLVTKLFFPPVRSALVRRSRLIDRLVSGLRGPLTLVAAPAGYGKTTLLGEWRATVPTSAPVAWISLDPGDNDLLRFQFYLTAAFETVQDGLTRNTRLLLQTSQPPPTESFCTVLINELSAFKGDLILALDDYHTITNPEIHAILTFLLDHLPPVLHLVLLTRADPPLPLARLRARGQLTEIRATHLRFTIEETAAFLNEIMGLKLASPEIAALGIRTEGWITGLQLAALSMQDRDNVEEFVEAFSGSHQYIIDYLVAEVLERQPNGIRDFLLKTSILERLTGPLCDQMTGLEDSQTILEMLAASNLFLIPLDDEHRWFRYHYLFADLLRNRFKTSAADQIPNLHMLASKWFDQNKMANEAIEHAFAAQAYAEVQRLMRDHFPEWWGRENWGRVFQWFHKFPKEFIHAEPWLCVVYAWMHWSLGELVETEKHLDCAQVALKQLKTAGNFPADDLEYVGLEAEILAFQALVTTQKNDPEKVIAMANSALELAPGEAFTVQAVAYSALQVAYRDVGEMHKAIEISQLALPLSIAGGQVGMIASNYNLLGVTLVIQGQLKKAKAVYRDALAYADRVGIASTPAFSLIRMRLADLHYQWNQLEEAEKHVREGLNHVDLVGNHWSMVYGRYLLCMIHLARVEHQEAQRLWQEIKDILPKVADSYYAEELDRMLLLVVIRLGIEDPSIFTRGYPEFDFDSRLTTTQLETLIQQAHYLVVQHDGNQAQALLVQLEGITEQRGNRFWLIEILVLQAICAFKQGNQKIANGFLQRALQHAEPEGYMRLFLDMGEPVRELLKDIRFEDQALNRYAQKLLTAFGTGSQVQAIEPPLITPLSKRELEVLDLIAAGFSNKEIASELVIAIGTVKRHIVNIFNKLDVKNRTEAVAKAREFGLM